MDRLDSMHVFVSVVETGSFSAAARKLGTPLPTISRKIAELESFLKTGLLIRTTRKLTLTDAGQTYLTSCRQILDAVNGAESTAAGEYSSPKGRLTVTAPIVFGRLHILPVTVEFLNVYPDVDVQLELRDSSLDLLDEHIDLALRIGELPDSRMIATRIGEIRQVVCASPAYLAKHGAPKTPHEIASHECITISSLMFPSTWIFKTGRVKKSITIHSRLIVNTAEAAIDAAVAGIGLVNALSYQVEAAIRCGALCIVLEKFESDPMPVSLIFAGQRLVPLKLRAFLDFATPRLRARLAGYSTKVPYH